MSFMRLLKKTQGREPGRAASQIVTLPAPVGGWNARDALQAMKKEDAVVLDNIIPDAGRVRLRDGFESHTTGMSGSYIESLMEYAPPSGASKLFSAAPANVYDVTSAGAVGAAVLTGKTNGRWQHTMFATAGGNFLCMVNGADGYFTYDGTTWTDSSASVVGVTAADLININAHMRRLWFIEKNATSLWYLGPDAITGTATELPVGPLMKLGGSLLAAGSWTNDGGDGMDDKLVIVTTKGEVIVYQGTDPDSAADWGLVGVFKIPEPVGRRCLVKIGGDLGIVTASGIALLSSILQSNASSQRKSTITNKIQRAFIEAYQAASGMHGWQIIEYPKQSLVIVNVPVAERATYYQFVVNVDTGGWCRFTGINANVWGILGDTLYFGGSDGKTYKFGETQSDNGEAIDWTIQMAFNKCGSPMNKIFQMVRPLMVATPGYAPGVQILVDYEQSSITVTAPPAAAGGGAEWDISLWDVSFWGTSVEKSRTWQSVSGTGAAASVVLVGSALDATFEFNEVDIMFQEGRWL